MFLRDAELVLSATDLSNFLGCRHRTALDLAVASGRREPPPKRTDLLLDVLIARGLAHEKSYVEKLKAEGRTVTDLSEIDSRERADELVDATMAAMRAGADIIVQGALRDGPWFGKPDVMRRIAVPSALGEWSYEVIDTKLTRETKAGTILQLGLYSAMAGAIQGANPEWFHVVTPDAVHPIHTFRYDDYAAYIRLVRRQLLETVRLDPDAIAAAHYPEPVEHCRTCRWAEGCAEKRRSDDHLSLVAGISRAQRDELQHHQITTLEVLARMPLPLPFRPKRGSVESFVKAREQARLQLESRGLDVPRFELRPVDATKGEGLCRLPEPSPGDVFIDLESDTFAADGGREYLFGVVTLEPDADRPGGPPKPVYQGFWGTTDGDERESYEKVMDLITAAWKRDSGMHVYHYAPYEPAAFKRLMGRYVTRERELDALLRNGRFVDLYAVVRQGLLAGVESYSIKKLEPLYGFRRAVALADANRSLRRMELALELNTPEMATPAVREAVRGYNADDCLSTLRLRGWLEGLRAGEVANGATIPRPAQPAEQEEQLNAHEERVAALRPELLRGIPDTATARSPEQQARWLLAYLLDYHRREDKASFWEYYRLKEMAEEDLFDEPQAIAGLEFVERLGENTHAKTGKPTGKVTDRYRYPAQEMEIERGELRLREGGTFGEVVAVDRAARTIDVLKRKDHRDYHPASVFAYTHIASQAQEDSLYAIAERVVRDDGVSLGSDAADGAGRTLLLAAAPVLATNAPDAPDAPDAPNTLDAIRASGDDVLAQLARAALALDHSVLPVQGPPGAGKTWAGAEMICALVEVGKRVGVAATSHKVIRKLLDEVAECARRRGRQVALAQKVSEGEVPASDTIALLKSNQEARRAFDAGDAQVLGGTAWVWSHADLAGSVDVLFVDEAGQMSLANVLAMSPAAKSIVLLGDPRQLEQPVKGSHPDGVAASALEHLLAGRKTIADDRGVFLPHTWRMCPTITSFTSELFYEARLQSMAGLEKQQLNGAADLDGGSLLLVKVGHDRCRTSSAEEVETVAGLVAQLTAPGATWTNRDGVIAQLTPADILVVAPYNAQVSRLTDRLAGTGVRVGTVDKFQGQEAPVAIYSMTTSRAEDAPRGMEFLYSLNRLNVATSRARCTAIVVASDRLFEPDCRTPRQMQLANALCRYEEMARALTRSGLRGDSAEVVPPASPGSADTGQVASNDGDLLPVRMLNEFVFCPRLFYFMHVEGKWEDNVFTLEGKEAHRRVDRTDQLLPDPKPAADGEAAEGDAPPTVVRSVALGSERLGLTAKLDLVSADGDLAVPVETKRGRVPDNPERSWEPERVQLMAQGLLLREHGYRCDEGVLYFAGSRTRVTIPLDGDLERATMDYLARAREVAAGREMPPPLEDSPKCIGCSLSGICLPDETAALRHRRTATVEESEDEPELRRLFPPRDTALPFYVQEQGARVGKRGGQLTVEIGSERIGGARVKDVSQLVLLGNVSVSPQTLHTLCDEGIPVVHLSLGHWFYGVTAGIGLRNAYDRAAQYAAAADSERTLSFAREVVEGKGANQRTFLARNVRPRPEETVGAMAMLLRKVPGGRSVDEVRGFEGGIAAHYFGAFAQMLRPRDFDATWDFASRNRRPPKDPVNALLSFGYAILAKECTVALLAEGLDPWWGLYHQPRHGRPALALDLMEEFRPLVVDSAVITAINTGMVTASSFERTAAACMLTAEGRKAFLRAYEARMDQMVTHPLFGYQCAWRSVIRVQARLLSRWLRGDVPSYQAIRTR